MNVFINESGAEILKAFRAPEFILPTLLMPMMFYSLFGILMPSTGDNAIYLLATYGIFAVMGPSIFGFGIGVASERDQGWLQLKRASPAPAAAYIGAKIITTILFATLALIPIYLIAGFVGSVALPRSTWLLLYSVHIVAVLPFILIGLSLGFLFGSSGAVAVSNIVFLGLAILGGLWFPVFMFPTFLQNMAAFTPSYHLGELALAVVNAPGEHNSDFNLATITIITCFLMGVAVITWLRQR